MSATPTMEAVHRYVVTHQNHDSVAVGLDTDWLVMAGLVQVVPVINTGVINTVAVRLMSEIDCIQLLPLYRYQ